MQTPSLSKIVGAVLALATSGCCLGVEDEEWSVNVSDVIEGELLDEIRGAGAFPDRRCEQACVELGASKRWFGTDEVKSCEVEPVEKNAGDPEDPWDPAYTQLLVTCTASGVEVAFCTGRRPLGHREAALALDSVGAWFAVHAHLEQASIAAFDELALWLAKHGAPTSLIERCRSARADEVDHARRMVEQARRFGAEVPALEAESGSDELLEVALHNAVEGCVSEAFAAVIAAHQARHAHEPELRELFGVLAADELRHGQLAWDLHAWLMGQLSQAQREWVERALALALGRLPALARRGAEATPAELGWPAPALAEAMASRFAALIGGARAAA